MKACAWPLAGPKVPTSVCLFVCLFVCLYLSHAQNYVMGYYGHRKFTAKLV